MRKIVISNIVLAIGIALVGYWFYSSKMGISSDAAKTKAEEFITAQLVEPGTDVKVKGVSVENDLYKLDISVGQQDITAYMSKDGKKFFPQGLAMDTEKIADDKSNKKESPSDVPKSDKPEVELFVMSYCPYGTQIEKGILPVLAVLGDKIDFKLKFVDYAMHQKKELDENLRQYCIQKNEPDKLANYLGCFLKNEKSDQCLSTAGIDKDKLNSCVSEADEKFQVTQKFNDKNTWKGSYPPFEINKEENEKYQVSSSPTLVINGSEVESKRDPQSLLTAICAAFNTAPEACQQTLSAETPAPGFGDGAASNSNSNSDCGN